MKLRRIAIFLVIMATFLPAQLEKVEHKPNPTKMVDFGNGIFGYGKAPKGVQSGKIQCGKW